MVVLKPMSAVAGPPDPRIPAELVSLAAAPQPWTSYLGCSPEGEAVGCCAFKRPPNQAREVEIAYLTFPEMERRGFGTAMVRGLVQIAAASGQVSHVLARTLREENPSVRICRRAGFVFDGEVLDPDDGPVWQWRKQMTGTLDR